MAGIADLEVRTARLHLRPWRRTDLDNIAAWGPLADPLEQTWNWTHHLHGMSLDFFFAAHRADERQHVWTLLAKDAPIGLLMLLTREAAHPSLGISLAGTHIGQGYGREALIGFADAFFARHPDGALALQVALANRRAVRLYQRLGFAEVRRFWRDAGMVEQYAFLPDPRYDDVRQFFRLTSTACYQLCADMVLEAETWRGFVV